MLFRSDYHLGQVLHTGKDFIIIDFEGDPTLPVNERRIKRSPLRDVAEMLQSFAFTAETAYQRQTDSGMLAPEQISRIQKWKQFWLRWASATFLKGYLSKARMGTFLPDEGTELAALLKVYMLERVVYGLSRQLNSGETSADLAITLEELLQTLQFPEFTDRG